MTALARIPARGTALLQSIAGVYTALDGLKSISVTGRGSKTVEVTQLNGPVTDEHEPTGNTTAAIIKANGHYNPAHATYTAFEGLQAAPVKTNFKVTYTDSGPTSVIYVGAGFKIDIKADLGQMVIADIEIQTTGNPA